MNDESEVEAVIEEELKELIRRVQVMRGESQTIELKAAHDGCPKRLYDTLSSFSNQDTGGIILLGIDERLDYKVVGVYDAQDIQKRVNEQCKQMTPVVRPIFTKVLLEEGCVVSVEIPGIDVAERPCFYSGVGRMKGSYIRVGDSDEPMSDYEIYSYEAFRKKYQDEIRLNEAATMEIIDENKLNQYIEQIKEQNVRLSLLSDEDIKRFLSMVIQDKPTLACTLLFSIYPQMLYPQYTINAMVVPGYQKGDVAEDGARFLDNKRIEGSIPELLDGAMAFLLKNMKIRTIVDPETGKRKDKMEYPVIAVREAVLNALIHRDYSVHTEAMPIEIIFYKNRLEIRNPGGLYGRLTVDQLGRVTPDTRNPVLARALEALNITENRYSGIPTMQRELREAGMKEAVFADSRREFVVTFYNDEGADIPAMVCERQDYVVYSDEEGLILDYCREPRSRHEIATLLRLSTISYMMKNYINPLIESGKLKMTKPDTPKSKNQKYYSDR